MTKTVKVEGMMCQHCEKHVQKALMEIDGIENAVADHEADKVEITLSKEVAEDDIKKAIEEAEYTYIGLE